MKEKPFMKVTKSNIFLLLTLVFSIIWFVIGFTNYGVILEKKVSDNLISLIRAITFVGMMGGFFTSFIIWLEETIESEKIKKII